MQSPAFSDARQRDVAAVRRALDEVAAFGRSIKLPLMTAAELFTLGALGHPMVDADALSWWNTQPDHDTLAKLAYGYLAKRKLLDLETGRLAPSLGLILAGRSRPAFILVTRDNPAADPNPLRLYGIAEEPGVVRAVLAEGAQAKHLAWAGPGYHYMLMGVATESRALAELAAGRNYRTFDVYRPGSGSVLPSERIVVTRIRHGLRADCQTPSQAFPAQVDCDLDGLTGLLASVMTGASQ
jgi:hypothetical protein